MYEIHFFDPYDARFVFQMILGFISIACTLREFRYVLDHELRYLKGTRVEDVDFMHYIDDVVVSFRTRTFYRFTKEFYARTFVRIVEDLVFLVPMFVRLL